MESIKVELFTINRKEKHVWAVSSNRPVVLGWPRTDKLQFSPQHTVPVLFYLCSKQMMDFLVQVAATHKLSPATHTFQLFSEETGRPVEYYASQSVGAMGIPTFHLVQKKSELQKKRERQRQSAQPTQPFEVSGTHLGIMPVVGVTGCSVALIRPC